MNGKHLIVLGLMSLMMACGSGSAEDGGDQGADGTASSGNQSPTLSLPDAVIVTQESMTLVEFEDVTGQDAALAALASGLTLEVAGITSDDSGVEVIWAEGNDSTGTRKTALRHCTEDDCVHALQTANSGTLEWRDASGAALSPREIGQPTLSKQLTGQSLDGQTVIAAQGLSSTNIDFVGQRRRATILSAVLMLVALELPVNQ